MAENSEIPLKTSGSSTTFTISFEDGDENSDSFKQKRIIKTANMFTKRHYRTLSLPIANNCIFPKNNLNKSGCELEVDGDEKNITFCLKKEKLNGAIMNDDIKSYSEGIELSDDVGGNSLEENTNPSVSESKDMSSGDTDSEGGTYTIDKNNEQVKQARKSIDQVFGISTDIDYDKKLEENKIEKKSRMINEWMKQSASVFNAVPVVQKTSTTDINMKNKNRLSKIPFPVDKSRDLGSTSSLNDIVKKIGRNKFECNSTNVPKDKINNTNLSNEEETDTKQYLKETENIVSALQKRIKTDMKPLHLEDGLKNRTNGQCDKELTPNKITNTRFNRAFRDRLKIKPSSPTVHTTIPVRSKTFVGTGLAKSTSHEESSLKNTSNIKRNNSFCRDFVKNEIMSPKAKLSTKTKNDSNKKPGSMSSQEIELHNWKRRKNYDPLKAVAEEKKKKSMAAANAASNSNSVFRKKEYSSLEENDDLATKIITRSASFHGLRHRNGYEIESPDELPTDKTTSNHSVSSYFISSNDDALEYENDNEIHWDIPKPPSTSLQNTPPESISSRLSLLSNAASNSSALLLSTSLMNKVDSNTVSKVTQLSFKIKDTVIALMDTLVEKNDNIFQTDSALLLNQNNSRFPTKSFDTSVKDFCDTSHENNSYEENGLDEDISPEYQLNLTLNNLQEIHQAVQRLLLKCSK